MHLLLRLPAGVDEHAVVERARHAGLRVEGLSRTASQPLESGGLVLGYGRLHESSIEPAVAELAEVVRPCAAPRRDRRRSVLV